MIVNGETLIIDNLTEPNIAALLQYFSLNKDHVAIEINGQIVKKAAFDNIELKENDQIELIHFVGGGC